MSLEVRMDGNHIRTSGKFRKFSRRDADDDVEIVQRPELLLHGRELDLVDQRERDGIRISVLNELHGERIRWRRDGISLCIGRAGARMDLVAVGVIAFPLHERGGA